jgi:hypothetical protein
LEQFKLEETTTSSIRSPSVPPLALLWCSSVSPLLAGHGGKEERWGGVVWVTLSLSWTAVVARGRCEPDPLL